MYKMKKEYFTGIEMVDKEHTRLFEIAEELYQLSHNHMVFDKYDSLVSLLNELTYYTKMHFAHEEEYMESINYKKMFSQKTQHRFFIDKLESTKLEELDENQEEVIDNLLRFLTDWLIEHIVELDKLITK